MFYLFYLYFIKFNSWRPWRNRRYNADDIFKCIFLRENVWIPNKISLKFVPKGPINNIPAMVQIMAWRRPGDKPLSEPMMVSLLTHICVTRPQWFNMCSTWSHLRAVHVCNIFIILGHAVMNLKKKFLKTYFYSWMCFPKIGLDLLYTRWTTFIWKIHC